MLVTNFVDLAFHKGHTNIKIYIRCGDLNTGQVMLSNGSVFLKRPNRCLNTGHVLNGILNRTI